MYRNEIYYTLIYVSNKSKGQVCANNHTYLSLNILYAKNLKA